MYLALSWFGPVSGTANVKVISDRPNFGILLLGHKCHDHLTLEVPGRYSEEASRHRRPGMLGGPGGAAGGRAEYRMMFGGPGGAAGGRAGGRSGFFEVTPGPPGEKDPTPNGGGLLHHASGSMGLLPASAQHVWQEATRRSQQLGASLLIAGTVRVRGMDHGPGSRKRCSPMRSADRECPLTHPGRCYQSSPMSDSQETLQYTRC